MMDQNVLLYLVCQMHYRIQVKLFSTIQLNVPSSHKKSKNQWEIQLTFLRSKIWHQEHHQNFFLQILGMRRQMHLFIIHHNHVIEWVLENMLIWLPQVNTITRITSRGITSLDQNEPPHPIGIRIFELPYNLL